jgi:hypothetical protein
MSHRRRFSPFASIVLFALGACGTSTRMVGGPLGQTDAERRQVIDRLVPTTRFVPAVKQDLLWTAARGYMEEMFTISPPPPDAKPRTEGERAVETETYEWFEGAMGYRTRIVARVAPEGVANAKLMVSALLIEAAPVLAEARTGEPLLYDWRLQGSNPKIEEIVADGIMRRYLALAEGLPPPALEFEPVKPIPGLTPGPKPAAGANEAPKAPSTPGRG